MGSTRAERVSKVSMVAALTVSATEGTGRPLMAWRQARTEKARTSWFARREAASVLVMWRAAEGGRGRSVTMAAAKKPIRTRRMRRQKIS